MGEKELKINLENEWIKIQDGREEKDFPKRYSEVHVHFLLSHEAIESELRPIRIVRGAYTQVRKK